MNAMTERNGHGTLIADPHQTGMGEVIADSLFLRAEASIRVRCEELVLDEARALANRVIAGQQKAIDELKARYRPIDAALIRLSVEASKPNLVRCFLSIHRDLAGSEEGRAQVVALVDRHIADTLKEIDALAPKEEAKPVPLSETSSEIASPKPSPASSEDKSSKGKSKK